MKTTVLFQTDLSLQNRGYRKNVWAQLFREGRKCETFSKYFSDVQTTTYVVKYRSFVLRLKLPNFVAKGEASAC